MLPSHPPQTLPESKKWLKKISEKTTSLNFTCQSWLKRKFWGHGPNAPPTELLLHSFHQTVRRTYLTGSCPYHNRETTKFSSKSSINLGCFFAASQFQEKVIQSNFHHTTKFNVSSQLHLTGLSARCLSGCMAFESVASLRNLEKWPILLTAKIHKD